MSERYWITSVQLGCLIAIDDRQERQKLIDEIIDKQFIGTKEDLQEFLKTKKQAGEGK